MWNNGYTSFQLIPMVNNILKSLLDKIQLLKFCEHKYENNYENINSLIESTISRS